MNAESFIDTNVLVYAAAGRGVEERKRKRALELIDAVDFGLSAQVLQEFYVTVTRKIDVPLAPEDALEWLEQWQAFPVVAIDTAIVKLAAELGVRYGISYWDAAILTTAEALGATLVYSEDLNHGQRYGTVTVENPFADR